MRQTEKQEVFLLKDESVDQQLLWFTVEASATDADLSNVSLRTQTIALFF